MRKRKPRGDIFAEFATRRDIARLLGVSTATISRMEKAGKLPESIYFAGVKLYRKADLDKWIQQITQKPGESAPKPKRKGKKT